MPASALLLAPDFTILAATASYLRDTMTSAADIVGRGIFDVFPDNPDDPAATGVAQLRSSLERVVASRCSDTMAVQKYDVRRSAMEGSQFEERHWSPVNSPVLDGEGVLVGIVHQVMDVTEFVRPQASREADGHAASMHTEAMEHEVYIRAQELQRVNERLRLSEERFRLLGRATNDIIWDWDLVTGQAWVSDGFEALLGYRPDEIEPFVERETGTVNHHAWQVHIHPDDRESVARQHAEAIESGASWQFEYRLIHRSGHAVWAESRGVVLRDDGGRAVRAIGGTRDLTAEKAAETRLREHAALIDQASDAIVVRDLDDRVLVWSAGAERLYGWAADEITGSRDPNALSSESDPRRLLQQAGAWHGESLHTTKDGGTVVVEERWTLLTDDTGAPRGVLVMSTDLTEQRRLVHRAFRDPLTGAANRALFEEHLDSALRRLHRHDHLAAVLVVDLDHFKEVNDTYGHTGGDTVLREVAARLERTVRASDTVARIGGDEFAIVLDELPTVADADMSAERIWIELTSTPVMIGDTPVPIDASVGVAVAEAPDEEVIDLLDRADRAMYLAKRADVRRRRHPTAFQ